MSSDAVKDMAGLSVRTKNALIADGHYTRENVEALTTLKMLHIPNMGIKSVQEVCEWLGREIPKNTTAIYRAHRAHDKQKAHEARIAAAVRWLEDNGYAVTKLSLPDVEL